MIYDVLRVLTEFSFIGYEWKADQLNVFLEYVSGGSIASCLARVGKFDEEISRVLMCQILCGLEYLHSKNIIHRDIKGGNSE
jgi:serine/threonine protein kinase